MAKSLASQTDEELECVRSWLTHVTGLPWKVSRNGKRVRAIHRDISLASTPDQAADDYQMEWYQELRDKKLLVIYAE